jgi:hypothetical protein
MCANADHLGPPDSALYAGSHRSAWKFIAYALWLDPQMARSPPVKSADGDIQVTGERTL